MTYKHTQTGYLIIFALFATALLFANILREADFDYSILATMGFILFILVSFVTLEVIIDGTYLKIKFGYGVFKKSFILKDIISARAVKNHWYNGWGIRVWFWPKMLIFNISGFDAVEIKMKDGKIYRIGTDEPKKLERAIMQVIKYSKELKK